MKIAKICKDCGNTFILKDSDIKFYESKNWCIPKRCECCRKTRKSIDNRYYGLDSITRKIGCKTNNIFSYMEVFGPMANVSGTTEVCIEF